MTRSREAGFSLIEVLVAFAIASIALTALVQVYSTSAGSARRTADMLGALEVAENRLTELSAVPLAAGQYGPEQEGGFVWQVDIVPEEAARADGDELLPDPLLRLLLVTVTVGREGATAPLVTLATARHASAADIEAR